MKKYASGGYGISYCVFGFSATKTQVLFAETEDGENIDSGFDFDSWNTELQADNEEQLQESLGSQSSDEDIVIELKEKEVLIPQDPKEETQEHKEEPQVYYYSVITYDCSGNVVSREDNIPSDVPRADEENRPSEESCRIPEKKDPPVTSPEPEVKVPEKVVEEKVEKVEEPVQQQYNHTPDIWVYVCAGLVLAVVVLFAKNMLQNHRRNKSAC